MSIVSVKDLLHAGVHFGHQQRFWNPKMDQYIFDTRKKISIINLDLTQEHLSAAASKVENICSKGNKVLFVGTKRAAREIIQKYAIDSKMPYVNNRWLGGMLTNFDTIKKSIAKLEDLKKNLDLATINGYTKKEILVIKKQIAKLEKNLSGIRDLEKTPDALFVIDTRYEKIAIQEANKLNIPVIAIVDSNNSFEGVDYMIPGNDDSMSSIELFVKSISKIISTTKGKFVKSSTSDSKESQKTMSAENTKTIKKKQIIDVKNEDVRSKNNSKVKKLDKES